MARQASVEIYWLFKRLTERSGQLQQENSLNFQQINCKMTCFQNFFFHLSSLNAFSDLFRSYITFCKCCDNYERGAICCAYLLPYLLVAQVRSAFLSVFLASHYVVVVVCRIWRYLKQNFVVSHGLLQNLLAISLHESETNWNHVFLPFRAQHMWTNAILSNKSIFTKQYFKKLQKACLECDYFHPLHTEDSSSDWRNIPMGGRWTDPWRALTAGFLRRNTVPVAIILISSLKPWEVPAIVHDILLQHIRRAQFLIAIRRL